MSLRLPRITYHAYRCPQPGEYVVPQGPRSRTAYLVHAARKVEPRPGNRRGPVWVLDVERIGREAVPAGAKVHPLVWFKRERKRRPGERSAG